MAKHGLSVERTAENPQARSREATGPLATGDVLQRPKGYAVPPDENFGLGHVEDLNPPKAATPEQRAAQLRRADDRKSFTSTIDPNERAPIAPASTLGGPSSALPPEAQVREAAAKAEQMRIAAGFKAKIAAQNAAPPEAPPGEVALPPAEPAEAAPASAKAAKAKIKADADEFRALVRQHGVEHEWVERPQTAERNRQAPGYRLSEGRTLAGQGIEDGLRARAERLEAARLGEAEDYAAALPALKALLEAHAKMVPVPMHALQDGSTFTRLGEKYTVKATNTKTGMVTIQDGKQAIKVHMDGTVKIDPGSEGAGGPRAKDCPRREADRHA